MNYSATVLLSGGLDSAAAMHWAKARHPTDAIGFDYGQANRDAELAAAGCIARGRSVPYQVYMLGEAVRGLKTLHAAPMGIDSAGVSLANLPARNAVMLSCAAVHAARRNPGGRIRLVIGCNADDAERFPDCRPEFIDAMTLTLQAALAGVVEDVVILAPWVRMKKSAIVKWAEDKPEAAADMAMSVSCYAGTACGECDACDLRASAFADAKAPAPKQVKLPMTGGDPGRCP